MQLLEQFYQIKSLLKKENLNENNLVVLISKLAQCESYMINSSGNVQCYAIPERIVENPNVSLKPEFKQRLDFIFDTAANLPLENSIFKEEKNYQINTFMTIVPIRNIQKVLGYFLLFKPKVQFSSEELILLETASLVGFHLFQ